MNDSTALAIAQVISLADGGEQMERLCEIASKLFRSYQWQYKYDGGDLWKVRVLKDDVIMATVLHGTEITI